MSYPEAESLGGITAQCSPYEPVVEVQGILLYQPRSGLGPQHLEWSAFLKSILRLTGQDEVLAS